MAKDNTSELLTNNNATYKVVNGVKYFKLVSEFEGDYTKNCGLLGNEIDENFYFLRGYDIKDVTFDEETKILTITRVDSDYEPMQVNIGWAIESDRPTFVFNRITGELTITYPDGTVQVCGGFLIEGSEDISIATDSTLRGKGTMYDPLGLAYTERTGTYAPAFDYFDISDETDEEHFAKMPEGMGKGYRVVTKELFNSFGYLYPYSAVEKIASALTLSEWRIPTKQDWDEMLNAMECPDYRNHSSYTSTFLGQKAGQALKSPGVYKEDGEGNVIEHTGAWKYFPVPDGEDEVYGQDFKGFTAFPVGYAENRNSFMIDNDNDVEGFRKATAFWTSTVDETNGQIYGKIFGHNTAQVYQQSFDDDSKLSIRLVKDYTLTNYEEYENILGLYYPTKLITGMYDDLPYSKVWTAINFYGDKDDLGGAVNPEWAGLSYEDASSKIVYFICEWDGEKWHKKQMAEGDSVVILNKDGEENYHEWRIIHGELVDTLDQTYAEFAEEFSNIRENLAELSASTIVFSSSVETILSEHDERITTLSSTTEVIENNVTVISGNLETLSSSTVELSDRIDAVSARTTEEFERVDGLITDLSGTVESLSAGTVEEIARVDADIQELAQTTASEIARLDDKIDAVSATTTEEIGRIDALIDEISGNVETLSASTVELAGDVAELSAATESGFTAAAEALEAEIARARASEDDLGDRIDDEAATRKANDLVAPADYTLTQEGTELLTNGGETITITVDENFFNFGEIIEGGRN